ncbi:MAG: O-methyltransferase [Candidatus Woesearchaeota archaeon]
MDILEKLAFLEEHAQNNHVPILGPIKGAWLQEYVQKNRPKTVLELGTAIGYSTIILASQGAKVISVDYDAKRQALAKEFASYFSLDCTFIHMDAFDYLEQCEKQNDFFDLVFLDITKKNYLRAFIILQKIANVIIADNTSHPACQDFMQEIQRFDTKNITLGDGLSITKTQARTQ